MKWVTNWKCQEHFPFNRWQHEFNVYTVSLATTFYRMLLGPGYTVRSMFPDQFNDEGPHQPMEDKCLPKPSVFHSNKDSLLGLLCLKCMVYGNTRNEKQLWLLVLRMGYSERTWLTHWGRMTHICVGKLTIIGSDNGLSPGRRQAIIWTNAGILLIGPLGTNFSEILSEIHSFSFKKMHLKMSSAKWRPFCFGLNVMISWLQMP